MTLIKLEDAVKAVEAAITCNGVGTRAIEQILADDAIKALRSLPTDDGVTDEMVAERLRSLGYTRLEFQLDSTGGHEATYYTAEGCERMGLGPLPAPPAC